MTNALGLVSWILRQVKIDLIIICVFYYLQFIVINNES
jgi:hypothetical protein